MADSRYSHVISRVERLGLKELYSALSDTAPWRYSSTVRLILRGYHQPRYLKLWLIRLCTIFTSLTETLPPRLSVVVPKASLLILVTPLESINISFRVSCFQKMFISALAIETARRWP